MRDINHWTEHPRRRGVAATRDSQALEGERNRTVEYRITRPRDGDTRWMRDSGFPIRDQRAKFTRVPASSRT